MSMVHLVLEMSCGPGRTLGCVPLKGENGMVHLDLGNCEWLALLV